LLNKLFTDPLIQKRDNEKSGVQQFWIADEEKKKVLKEIGVDELDAELHLADILWNDRYGKE